MEIEVLLDVWGAVCAGEVEGVVVNEGGEPYLRKIDPNRLSRVSGGGVIE